MFEFLKAYFAIRKNSGATVGAVLAGVSLKNEDVQFGLQGSAIISLASDICSKLKASTVNSYGTGWRNGCPFMVLEGRIMPYRQLDNAKMAKD